MNNRTYPEVFYNVVEIIRGTTVDGPGFRTAIYLAGCHHNCEGCHNPLTHNPGVGNRMSLSDIMDIVIQEDFNVTITGGDPLFFPEKLRTLVHFLKENRRDVWIYTGYTWEEIMQQPSLADAIKEADVLVDGRFEISLRDPDLRFKGSSNQRIINIPESLSLNKIVLKE